MSKQEQFRWRILQTRDLLATGAQADPADADPEAPAVVGPVVPADVGADPEAPDAVVDRVVRADVTRARTCTRT